MCQCCYQNFTGVILLILVPTLRPRCYYVLPRMGGLRPRVTERLRASSELNQEPRPPHRALLPLRENMERRRGSGVRLWGLPQQEVEKKEKKAETQAGRQAGQEGATAEPRAGVPAQVVQALESGLGSRLCSAASCCASCFFFSSVTWSHFFV